MMTAITLEGRININYRDREGKTALHHAAELSSLEKATLLVENGANLEARDNEEQTPLLLASWQTNSIDMVSYLLQNGANVEKKDFIGSTALHGAARRGNVGLARILGSKGLSVNLQDEFRRTPLHIAAHEGKVDFIRYLDEEGASLEVKDMSGETPLSYACKKPNFHRIISFLLDKGADVKTRNPFGSTLLHGAVVTQDNVESARILVQRGIDVDATDHFQRTPLHAAARGGMVASMNFLIGNGATIDARDLEGATPLHEAARSGNIESFLLLVEQGASLTQLSLNQTPLDDLVSRLKKGPSLKDPKIVQLLSHARGSDFFVSLRGISVDITAYIVQTCRSIENSPLDRTALPFNISFNEFFGSPDFGVFFRWGRDTVVSIFKTDEGGIGVASMKATAPICAGDGRVIYTKQNAVGDYNVYENSIKLRGEEEKALCHELSSNYEKNWGCFNNGVGNNNGFHVVYSVFPLRIFKVDSENVCSEERRVVSEYPRFQQIEKLWGNRDERNTSVFRGGSRGIEFGDEFLFVGHVTLYGDRCYPQWYVQQNITPAYKRYPRMYFMYFFTIKIEDNDKFRISRISSCFQPPSARHVHKIIFPVGIMRRHGPESEIVVSYGRNDQHCVVTAYTDNDINILLRPIDEWNVENYVFHPNYATSVMTAYTETSMKPRDTPVPTTVYEDVWRRSQPENLLPVVDQRSMKLSGTPLHSKGLFNPAITRGTREGTFVIAWRSFRGNVRSWEGENYVALESGTLGVAANNHLQYTPLTERFEFKAGISEASGEDPRLVVHNDCPILMINDVDGARNRRMYVHNMTTDSGSMTLHKFCHDTSGPFEKNWGPFFHENEMFFVYSIDPLKIGKSHSSVCASPVVEEITCSIMSEVETPTKLTTIFKANGLMMRGGTPGLKIDDNEYLFVGHAVQGRDGDGCFPDTMVANVVGGGIDEWHKEYGKLYTIFFYTVSLKNDEWVLNRLSCCSQLPGKQENFTKIVFPCGLARAKLEWDRELSYVVSFGEHDRYGSLCAFNQAFLDFVLRPVDEWSTQTYVVDVNYFANIATLSPVKVNP